MNDESPKLVRHRRQPLSAAQQARLAALAQRSDSEIDFSDIPELTDTFFDTAERGAMHRMLKQQLTIRLDADVLDWFKRHAKDGKGYQTDINAALRAYIAAQQKRAG